MERRIPVQVLNSRNPEGPGTKIVPDEKVERSELSGIRSIAHKDSVNVVTVVSPRMVARPGFLARISRVFEEYEVSVDMISTTEVSVSLSTDVDPSEVPHLEASLSEFASVLVSRGSSLISLVGQDFSADEGAIAKIFATIAECRVPVQMISYGATRMNISLLVPETEAPRVLNALHDYYF